MVSFDAWIDGQAASDTGVVAMRELRASLGEAWPAGGDGWAAYAAAIAASAAIPDKRPALAALERAHSRYRALAQPPGFWRTIAGWISNVYFWAVLLGGAVTFGLFGFGLDRAMLAELAEPDRARGLITFLFAVATVGISLVIVLAIFLSTGSREEVGARFQMGKDVLAVLIGVLGTIIGFYFGSEKAAPAAVTTGIAASPATAAADGPLPTGAGASPTAVDPGAKSGRLPPYNGQITGTRNTATTPNQTISGRPSFQ